MTTTQTPASDDQTLTVLYRTHVAMIRARCRRVLGDGALAEDVTQEAFMLLFDRIRAGRPPEQPAAFLYRAATTRSLNALRNQRRRDHRIVAADSGMVAAPCEGSPDARLDLAAVLAVVHEELATVAICYYVDGMQQDEIGEVMGLHRRTVSRRLDDFRAAALRILGDKRGVA